MQWLPESYLTMIATTSLPAALVLALAITTTFLIATAITGTRGRRRTHLRLVGASIISFAGTVVLAEALGRAWVFEERSLRIHLFFAHAATTALLAVIATGMARIHRPGFRHAHRLSVLAFACLLLTAVGTGSYMLTTGQPRTEDAPLPPRTHSDQPTSPIPVQASFQKEER